MTSFWKDNRMLTVQKDLQKFGALKDKLPYEIYVHLIVVICDLKITHFQDQNKKANDEKESFSESEGKKTWKMAKHRFGDENVFLITSVMKFLEMEVKANRKKASFSCSLKCNPK